tara:strand:- start:481 stop:648 length:168 start_codon:yes stop_codon:yes gene_type:complete
MRIIYIGNILNKHGFTPTSVEILGEKLSELTKSILKTRAFKNLEFYFSRLIESIK